MAKQSPFFSHDMNARGDPKILAMRGVHGQKGYGMFWTLVEMMAEADGYKLNLSDEYAFDAYALEMQCTCIEAQSFVTDCIKRFKLFESDGVDFWSNTLRKRMKYRDAVSEIRAKAANKRWGNSELDANAYENDANALHVQSKSIANESNFYANAMQKDANETKQNKTKKEYADYVFLTESEYGKLTEELGHDERDRYFLRFAAWISDKPVKMQKSRSAYLTILNWHRENNANGSSNVAKTGQAARRQEKKKPNYAMYAYLGNEEPLI